MLHFSASTSAKHTIESWEDTNQNQSEMFRSGRYDVSNGSAPLPLGRRRKPNNLQYGCIDTESTFLRHVAVQFPNSWILLYKRTVSCNYTSVSENSNNFPNIGCQTQSQAALSVENAVNDTTRSGFQKVIGFCNRDAVTNIAISRLCQWQLWMRRMFPFFFFKNTKIIDISYTFNRAGIPWNVSIDGTVITQHCPVAYCFSCS